MGGPGGRPAAHAGRHRGRARRERWREALTNASTPVYLNEFEPTGGLVTALALPTSASGSNKALLDSGTSTSDGQMTLSGNAECLLTVGYDAPAGIEKITESSDKTYPRTVAVINGKGEINTTTALTNFANENNARSATSSECKKLWVGGAGGKSTGGVVEAEVGASNERPQLDENDANVRQVEVVGGQLYASADPTKAPEVSIGKVGSGLPTTKGQTITSLPFEALTAPEEPYAYSLLTLGMPGPPDTLYVADNKRSEVVKYGLSGGKWVEHGAVEVPAELTGVTANDVNGAVTIYATSSGSNGKGGTLFRISDVSGVNGTLSGIPVEIAKAPANEAFRGVAFAPGTTIGSGGTPPPAPTISAAETALPAAIGDPTNQSMPITVGDSAYAPSELTVSVTSSKESVAPVSGITVTGTGTERTLTVTPAAVGISTLTLTVEAPDRVFTSTQVNYGASEYLGSPSDRYYSGASEAATAIDVGDGYMIVGEDESNTLNLYHERTSGPPVKSFDFDSELPYGATEVNIHSSARAGNTIYWAGSLDNTNSGEVVPAHDTIFAATITGSGANTELTYLGSYTGLKEDLIEWDNANGAPLGLATSAAPGQAGERANGFKLQGVEFAPGSTTEAYLTFRAPLEPPGEGPEDRNLALVIPVTNFSSLFTDGNPGTTHATFGTPLEWNLGGLSIRQIRKNAEGEYVIVASTPNSSDTVFQLWGWDGEAEDEPVLLNASIPLVAEGVWSGLPSVPEPIANGDGVEVLQDNSKTVWYGPGTKDGEKGLTPDLQKDLGRLITVEIPLPGTPNPPHLSQGVTPNKGQFTLRWKPAPTLRARFTLQHQNARGGWSTVATGLSKREYTFAAGNPEEEGTWTYRVKESNETGESGYSEESQPIKVEQDPAAHADRERVAPARLRRQRRLVQEQRHGLVHGQRRPRAVRRQPRQRRQSDNPGRTTDLRNERLARSVRDGRGQCRQRLGTGLSDGAGRCHATEPRNLLPGDGSRRRSGRDGDRDRLRRLFGPRQRPERDGFDRHERRRTADDHPHGGLQRRAGNDQVVHDPRRIPDSGRADGDRRGEPEQRRAVHTRLERRRPAAVSRPQLHTAGPQCRHRNLVNRGQRHRSVELRILGRRRGRRHVGLPCPGV